MQAATETAASVGRGLGVMLIFLGLLSFLNGAVEGLWLSLIGLFIVTAAGAEARGAQASAALSRIGVRELMSAPVMSIPGQMPVAQAAAEFFLPYRFTAFPVLGRDGAALGLLTRADVQALTPRERERCVAADIAERDPGLPVRDGDDTLEVLERAAFARVGRAVVVDAHGRPEGMLSITDVQLAMSAAPLLPVAETRRGRRPRAA